MEFDKYQSQALTTAKPTAFCYDYLIPGLAAEAGEISGKFAKWIRDGDISEVDFWQSISEEIGDVLWFLAVLSNEIGENLSDIAQRNLDKLADRQERGVIGGSGDKR